MSKNLKQIEIELKQYDREVKLVSFGYYLHGIILKGLHGYSIRQHSSSNDDDERKRTHSMLFQSMLLHPCDWSAYIDLANCFVENRHLHFACVISFSYPF